jgi:hypothetical protein
MILGGCGNFGKRISTALIKKNIPVIIAGRNKEKLERFAATFTGASINIAVFDAKYALATQLTTSKPSVVINTCGPFQNSNYDIARICVEHSVHYIDIADARDFVTGIVELDTLAKENNVSIISGASTVPGLSSAVIEHYRDKFSIIDSLVFGITPGQKAERGLATTQAILSYVGKPLKPFAGSQKTRYGWQDIYRQNYPEIGKRWMANCDIPDLDLLPAHYNIRTIHFSAGMELGWMHLGLWFFSWLVRAGLPLRLSTHAEMLLKISNWFNLFGSADGGMHVILRGKDQAGAPLEKKWFIIAKAGDGPQIPCVPAILLAEKLVVGKMIKPGAYPCVGLISLEEYVAALKEFNIQ